jgi:hypothetical protein
LFGVLNSDIFTLSASRSEACDDPARSGCRTSLWLVRAVGIEPT